MGTTRKYGRKHQHRILVTLPEDDTALLAFLGRFAARRKRSALVLFALRLVMTLMDEDAPTQPLPDPEDVARQIIERMLHQAGPTPGAGRTEQPVLPAPGKIKVVEAANNEEIQTAITDLAMSMFG